MVWVGFFNGLLMSFIWCLAVCLVVCSGFSTVLKGVLRLFGGCLNGHAVFQVEDLFGGPQACRYIKQSKTALGHGTSLERLITFLGAAMPLLLLLLRRLAGAMLEKTKQIECVVLFRRLFDATFLRFTQAA